EQNCFISSFVPGSWAPNWLQGNPSTAKPLSLYFSYTDSKDLYCGVKPQCEATFTINSTLPRYDFKETSFPSMSFTMVSETEAAERARACISVATQRIKDSFIKPH